MEEECTICKHNDDGGQGEDEDNNDDNDNDESKEDEEDDLDDDRGKKNGEESTGGSGRKRKKRISDKQRDRTGQQPLLQGRNTTKRLKHAERDWLTSAPYDKSVPYSHRYGYTWKGTTSNDLMKMWQASRKPAED